MKQLIQEARTGELSIVETPPPQIPRGGVLVRTRASLVSAGTERTIVDFAEKNLLQKARSRPDLVRQTLEKVRRDGVFDTIDAVRSRLDRPITLGYSAAGVVLESDTESGFRVGDRVACAGAGYAVHAEMIAVPRNLTVPLPDEVSFEEGAFCTVGAIALHGLRIGSVQLGDTAAVIGLGLLGQLTVQMLRAAGCVVLGTDPRADRAELARSTGAHWAGTDVAEFAAHIAAVSSGRGADAVFITADTPSDQPVQLAGDIARSRGAVIAVGAVGTHLPRASYFQKELAFRISRSYGPGRYDKDYEEKGRDYPHDYVRWTENRNMQAFAAMLQSGAVRVVPLISHRFPIEEGVRAYDVVLDRVDEPSLGVILRYDREVESTQKRTAASADAKESPACLVKVGVLGAGAFANGVLFPILKKTDGVELRAINSSGGLSARTAAHRFGFDYCAASIDEILADTEINTVAILTRHDLHASQTIAALDAGKHVFVEKPLCLSEEQLEAVIAARARNPLTVTVGYNRRFAPFMCKLRDAFREVNEPLMLTCRVNGGYVADDHWTQDPEQGGRLIGEGCHFFDLLIYLGGARVHRVRTVALPNGGRYRDDNFQTTLEFVNGTVGVLSYVANGPRSFGKEAIEVFGGGLAARMDDYRSLIINRRGSIQREKAYLRPDKGHRGQWEAIAGHLTGTGPAPISFEEIVHSTRSTLAAWKSLHTSAPVLVDSESLDV